MKKIEHGGNLAHLAKAFGYQLEECLDFSANINPLGLSSKLRQSLIEAIDDLTSYPDHHYSYSQASLKQYHKDDDLTVLLANGAVDIFYDLARYLKPHRILLLSPTFMEYEKAFSQVGADILLYSLEAPAYDFKIEPFLSQLEQLDSGDVVLLCNPNNPTGSLISNKDLLKIAEYVSKKGILLIIDEAFTDFLENEEEFSFVSFLKDYHQVIVVKSLTKFYAIPGLRLGYALSYHECLTAIDDRRAPWSVNSLADAILPTLLTDEDYRRKTKEWLYQEKNYLTSTLTSFSALDVLAPSVNYIFFTYSGEKDLKAELWRHKILIRSCANYHGLTNQHFRIAIRSHEENQRLITALSHILSQGNQHE